MEKGLFDDAKFRFYDPKITRPKSASVLIYDDDGTIYDVTAQWDRLESVRFEKGATIVLMGASFIVGIIVGMWILAFMVG